MKTTMLLIPLLFALVCSGCSSSPQPEENTALYSQELNDTIPETSQFYGYTCTDDCSGHEAGYQWAEDNAITSPDDCSGNSDSFLEGCESYAEENSLSFTQSFSESSDEEGLV